MPPPGLTSILWPWPLTSCSKVDGFKLLLPCRPTGIKIHSFSKHPVPKFGKRWTNRCIDKQTSSRQTNFFSVSFPEQFWMYSACEVTLSLLDTNRYLTYLQVKNTITPPVWPAEAWMCQQYNVHCHCKGPERSMVHGTGSFTTTYHASQLKSVDNDSSFNNVSRNWIIN